MTKQEAIDYLIEYFSPDKAPLEVPISELTKYHPACGTVSNRAFTPDLMAKLATWCAPETTVLLVPDDLEPEAVQAMAIYMTPLQSTDFMDIVDQNEGSLRSDEWVDVEDSTSLEVARKLGPRWVTFESE